ncbi:hypothetical protein HELRODRAFT_168890 [Helobdella robusta]|uniref:Uncharacterized protein n=1 Tax=Helobdella robusta TaxID=6412 RepID=T1F137_HELRO|nr:hypothetical protein HELRODRAFT_168890 [Helobdella robusta]ESO08968.1 hypothetical protein HELRODRAFT_168890 [Helobdella robusta]
MRKERMENLTTTGKIAGKRDRGQQRITFVKSLCHLLNITTFQLLQSVEDRVLWSLYKIYRKNLKFCKENERFEVASASTSIPFILLALLKLLSSQLEVGNGLYLLGSKLKLILLCRESNYINYIYESAFSAGNLYATGKPDSKPDYEAPFLKFNKRHHTIQILTALNAEPERIYHYVGRAPSLQENDLQRIQSANDKYTYSASNPRKLGGKLNIDFSSTLYFITLDNTTGHKRNYKTTLDVLRHQTPQNTSPTPQDKP